MKWTRLMLWMSVLAVTWCSSASSLAATVTVNIVNSSFQPSSVTVNVGDTVTWVQKDTLGHTTTSDTGVWSSPLLSLNQTFSHTFDTAGSFPYFCIPHPFMRGTVTVQGAPVNQPPTVSITSPSSGATVTGPDVTLEATASDPDGSVAKVQFFSGRTSLGEATSSPYRVTTQLEPGTYNITAQVTDNQGATASSAVISVTVATAANTPPTVTLSSPAEGATFTAPATVALEAQASDPDGSVSKVEFFAGDTLVGSVNATPFTFSWDNVPEGSYMLVAKATDDQGAVSSSTPVHIQVSAGPATAPTLSGPIRMPDGMFQFIIQGAPGQKYMVQSSTDLKTWNNGRTVTADSASFAVIEMPPADAAFLFYRVQATP